MNNVSLIKIECVCVPSAVRFNLAVLSYCLARRRPIILYTDSVCVKKNLMTKKKDDVEGAVKLLCVHIIYFQYFCFLLIFVLSTVSRIYCTSDHDVIITKSNSKICILPYISYFHHNYSGVDCKFKFKRSNGLVEYLFKFSCKCM